MSKEDFRLQFPLWNIGLYIILMIWFYGIVSMFKISVESYMINVFYTINNVGVIALLAGFVLLIIYFISYFMRLNKHNTNNPEAKMSAFTIIKLNEFVEGDELFRDATKEATKKVYTFYAQMIPLIILLMLFPIERYVFIFILFLLLIIQNLIFYRHIRRYLEG